MRRLAEMTTDEAREAAAAGTIVVLPAGAMEQHGPGMPLGTDTIRAEAVTEQVARRLPDLVVIGPSLPVGVSPHHLAMPGTLSLRPATFAAVVREYVDGLVAAGWRRVLVVTGHGGNNATLGTVAQDLLRDHPDLEFAWTPVTALAKDEVAAMHPSEVSGHSGEAETAQMLAVAPHLVHVERLSPGSTTLADLDPLARLARRSGQPTMAFGYDRLAHNGVLGDPRSATADHGHAILAAVVARIGDFVSEWSAT